LTKIIGFEVIFIFNLIIINILISDMVGNKYTIGHDNKSKIKRVENNLIITLLVPYFISLPMSWSTNP